MAVISSTPNLTVHAPDKPFSILRPRSIPPRTGDTYQHIATAEDLDATLEYIQASEFVAVDLETRGLDYLLPDTDIVGIGLAGDKFSAYFHCADIPQALEVLTPVLAQHKGLLAHNVYFDGAWLYHRAGLHWSNWHMCTYALYRHLASEGFIGQKWGLKDAEADLLLWPVTNEVELGNWLEVNGHVKQNKSPDWGEMWRAPADVLGKYCCLDVEATYLLYTQILRPAMLQFPGLVEHMQKYMRVLTLHIWQRMEGMLVDIPKMQGIAAEMERQITELTQQFLIHKDIAPHIAAWEGAKLAELESKAPEKYLRSKLGKEPAQFRKDGQVSKNWLAWAEKRDAPPTISKNWENWNQRYEVARSGQDAEYRFNLNSGDQLRWLLFEQLGYTALEHTESGLPSISGHVLRQMGEAGDLLRRRGEVVKELSYISEYIALAQQYGGRLHPSFRWPGTLTGRPSSYGINLLQIPKTKACMECFVAPPGYVIVDCDVSALEPTVTAEITQDENLLFLYGPGSKPNDIYLYYGAGAPDPIGPAIRATGYDPRNPTPETLARAKKECKFERNDIMKPLYLSDAYGSGAGKKHQILQRNGVKVPFETVQALHDSLQEQKAGIIRYVSEREQEWKVRKGWVMSPLGKPITVHRDALKDILNRIVQRTGHDMLVRWVCIAADLLDEAGIEWTPYILDWYDATSVVVPEKDGERTAELIVQALNLLNEELGGTIPLKTAAEIGTTLAAVKQPEA